MELSNASHVLRARNHLAFPNEPLNDGDLARIEYSRGHNGGGAGTLHPGGKINVKVNMVFDVYVTIRS